MLIRSVTADLQPFFSICVPQYNRTSFFLQGLRSIVRQSIDDYEICISDDCSTDGRQDEIVRLLQDAGVSFQYLRQESNVRYDANLRAAISLARGRYVFLLGNDDCLASTTTLETIRDCVRECSDDVGVVVSNFVDWTSGLVRRRVTATGLAGRGPNVAVRYYREFSFVSGILLETTRAQANQSSAFDGSEMYQMYIGCRILAEGAALLTIELPTVKKDVQVPGERVDSYASGVRIRGWRIVERRVPVLDIPRLVTDAIEPFVHGHERSRYAERIILQFLVFTFPYWVVEFRNVHSMAYSIGFCLAARVRRLRGRVDLGRLSLIRLRLVHVGMSVAGLSIPLRVFRTLYPALYRLAKVRRWTSDSLKGGIQSRTVGHA